MERNAMCAECRTEPATCFCICSSLPFICTYCDQKHRLQSGFHYLLPSASIGIVTPQNQQRYRVWLLSLSFSQEKLSENLQSLDRCKQEIDLAYESAKRQLDEIRHEQLSHLQRLKEVLAAKVQNALFETSQNATNFHYAPSGQYERLVWTHATESSSDAIPVFVHSVKVNDEVCRHAVTVEMEGVGEELAELSITRRDKGEKLQNPLLPVPHSKCYVSDKSTQTEDQPREQITKRLKVVHCTAEDTLQCAICKKSRNTTHFSVSTAISSHRCKICDKCFSLYRGAFEAGCVCPACGTLYTFAEQCALRQITNSSSHRRLCRCGRTVSPNGYHCVNYCECSTCLLTHYLTTRVKHCGVCKERLPQSLPTEVQCSVCRRALQPNAESAVESVCGVCPCGAILCCFCIDIRAGGKCGLCGKVVSAVGGLGELAKMQQDFIAACYCGSGAVPLARLRCGHMAHAECRLKVSRCRICKGIVKESPPSKLLFDYIPTHRD